MKYKSAFRLGVRLIAVLVCAQSLAYVSWGLAALLEFAFGGGSYPTLYLFGQLLAGPIQLVAGVVLWRNAGFVANLAIPSNKPYCQECGYDLSDRTESGICPECGVTLALSQQDLDVAKRRRFESLCFRIAPSADPARVSQVFSTLALRYGEPHRAYHTLDHVLDCLHTLDRRGGGAEATALVEFAIWFHDCIYDPRRGDNEERSAQQAIEALEWLGVESRTTNIVRGLILATRHKERPDTPDEALIVDIDLAILGADQPQYDAYAAAIRREYSFASDAEYSKGRSEFLTAMLARDQIYNTVMFQRSHGEPARANLKRELASYEKTTHSS